MPLPATHRSRIIGGLRRAVCRSLGQDIQIGPNRLHEPTLLVARPGPDEQHMRREDRAPGGQLARLAVGMTRQGGQSLLHRQGQAVADGGEIDDRRRDSPSPGHNVGTEDGQIMTGVGEHHAVQDLQAGAESGGFQVQLAQAACLVQLVANEQILPIKAAADRLQGRVDGQRLKPHHPAEAQADPLSQGIDERMDAFGDRGFTHGCPLISRMAILTRRIAARMAEHAQGHPGWRNGDALLPGLGVPQRHVLSNGAEIVSLALTGAPLVCLDFWCRAGSAFESGGESGMAHFLEHMVFKGSAHLNAGEFDRRIEALGGSSNAATGFDDVHYHVLIPPSAAAEALDLLLDLVLRPRLEREAFAMERRVVLEELAQSEDQPEEVALQTLLTRACPDHPYGLPILGSRERLMEHDPAGMAAFHQRLYGATRCELALSGALDDEALLDHVTGGPLGRLAVTSEPPPPPPLRLQAGEERLELPRLEAARLLMAWWQPAAGDLDAVMGADLATTVLAEGRRSRLVEQLRERLRIVESVDLDLHPMECGSLALLEAVCEVEELPAVRRAIEMVWQEVMQEPVEEAEWSRAVRLVSNSYRFGLESAGAVAAVIGNGHLWGRRQPLGMPLETLARWNPERLRCEALRRLDPRNAFVLEAVPA